MTRFPRSAWILSGVLAAVVVSQASPVAQREKRERGVVVAAWTSAGAPASGLTESDFTVREDELTREVIRVSAAAPPSHIWLLVDDSQASEPAIMYLRGALDKLIKRLAALTPAPQIALMTFGDRPTRRADFAPTVAAVEQAAARLFPVLGSGAYFMQAVRDAATDLRKRETTNPVIVAFVAEGGPEFSHQNRKSVREALEPTGASLWTVVLESRAEDLTPEGRERTVVIGDLTVESGGVSKGALSPQGLDPMLDSIGALVASRYLVVYGRPEQTIPPKSVQVTSKRPDVRVSASRWLR